MARSPCVFHNKNRGLWVSVRGDDVVVVGAPKETSWFKKLFEGVYQIKMVGIGE